MDYSNQIENLEFYLKNNFPNNMQNYYNNISDVNILNSEEINSAGKYDPLNNLIILKKINSIYHEFAHMCFNDREKINKYISYDESLYEKIKIICNCKDGEKPKLKYSNGIVFSFDNFKFCSSLNEGMAEYISREITNEFQGQEVFYYFTRLLILIYGEDILNYALLNDPVGLLNDGRFYNISNLIFNLDCIKKAIDIFILYISDYNKFLSLYTNEKKLNESKILKNIEHQFKIHFINSMKCILQEYNNCISPKITKEEFLDELNLNKNYRFVFRFDNAKYSVNRNIRKLIFKFKHDIDS